MTDLEQRARALATYFSKRPTKAEIAAIRFALVTERKRVWEEADKMIAVHIAWASMDVREAIHELFRRKAEEENSEPGARNEKS